MTPRVCRKITPGGGSRAESMLPRRSSTHSTSMSRKYETSSAST